MPRRPLTVRALASEFGIDLDEALVTLWEAGFDDILDVDDRLPAADVAQAQHALGVGTLRELRTLAYWQRKLNLDRQALSAHLDSLGVRVSPDARVLPKGALSKLRSHHGAPAQLAIDAATDADIAAIERTEPAHEPPLVWQTVGQPRACALLTSDEVRQIHSALEVEFANTPDPITPSGLRDVGLLESALYRTETSIGGESKYPSVEMISAALMHSLIHNHAFFNGNKRTALVSLLALLDRNNLLLTSTETALFRYVLLVAQHRLVPEHWSQSSDREVLAIATWINQNSRALERRERPLKWRELKRILANFDCTFDRPLPGNKLKIYRVVRSRRRLLGRAGSRALQFHANYAGDGRDVSTDQLHRLRQTLELDDAHGYDSAYFYGTDTRAPDEFIAEYRTILKRLAKL